MPAAGDDYEPGKGIRINMMILPRAHLLNNRGQAMVEMAFVIGLLVLLIFGMTEFGRAMYTKNTLNNLARAGARVAVVTTGITDTGAISDTGPVLLNSTCSYSSPCTSNDCIYKAVCDGIVAGIKKTDPNPANAVKVAVQIFKPNGTPEDTTPVPTGDTIKVTVRAGYDPVLALMRSMIGAQLTGEASMRYER